MSLSKKELEELKPWVEDSVRRQLGYKEDTVVKIALFCVSKNLDRRSCCDQLSSLLDDNLAPQFVDDLFNIVTQLKQNKNTSSGKGAQQKKRTLEDVFGDKQGDDSGSLQAMKKTKQSRFDALKDDDVPLPPTLPEQGEGPTPLSQNQISAMMATMKKQIEERKRQLTSLRQSQPVAPVQAAMQPAAVVSQQHIVPSLIQQQQLMNEAIEKAKRAAELQAKIQAKLASKPNLVSTSPTFVPVY